MILGSQALLYEPSCPNFSLCENESGGSKMLIILRNAVVRRSTGSVVHHERVAMLPRFHNFSDGCFPLVV